MLGRETEEEDSQLYTQTVALREGEILKIKMLTVLTETLVSVYVHVFFYIKLRSLVIKMMYHQLYNHHT